MEKSIILPEYILNIMERFTKAGHEVYVAGGAVRDALAGKSPQDFDLCTSALPGETKALFPDTRVVETGIRHGTVTVLFRGKTVEITTWRKEDQYSDGRHPDTVTFVSDLREDMSRRDFTVNAMAYSPATGLIDFFDGIHDLEQGILRCIGDPERRFSEDGLRIMRALRFMSVRGFRPDPETDRAIRSCCHMLDRVAYERIDEELLKFLSGDRAAELLDRYREVFAVIIPELAPMFDFDQKSPYHNRDVWQHTLAAVAQIRPDPQLRMTMLLHDIAKPVVFVEDETGRGHFLGHQKKGAEMAEEILRRMKFPSSFIELTVTLVREHDRKLSPERPLVRRYLNLLGEEALRKLLDVQMADASGKYEQYTQSAFSRLKGVRQLIDQILRDGDCIHVGSLNIDGHDLIGAGLEPGPVIGEILQELLEAVMEERLPNDREALMAAALSEISVKEGKISWQEHV